jgi:glycosyltransferase involved in cell wall biosynthesis
MTQRPLLFVANSRWNLAHFRGGLIASLRDRGWRIEAAVPDGDADVSPTIPTHHFPLIAEGTAPLAELRTLLGLIRILRARKPAAVLSFTPKGNIYAGLAARAVGIPLLPNVSGLGTAFIRGGILQKISVALYREAFRGLPVVFFQNGDDARLFEELGIVEPGQAHLLPGSGVDCRRFKLRPLPSTRGGEVELLFVGRLLGDKGVRELAGAMRIVRSRRPGIRLTLLGELGAANRTAITAEEVAAWEREGLLRHAGKSDDVCPFLAAADAVVLPSYREGMPRSLLEAAAMGRPMLAANVPGCRDLVSHGENGFLFEARSAESLARAIEQFADLPVAKRQAMGASARRLAETRYDEKIVWQAYHQSVIALTEKGR